MNNVKSNFKCSKTFARHTLSTLAFLTFCFLLLMTMCGVAAAETYYTNEFSDVNSGNCDALSALISNANSRINGNINVNSGMLNISAANIRMDNGRSINVKANATLNVIDDSLISHYTGYYGFNYEAGSYGTLSASTIQYSTRLSLATGNNNVYFSDSTFRYNQYQGIYVTASNVSITDCTLFQNNDQGIRVDSNNVSIIGCTFNDNKDEGLYITSTDVNVTDCLIQYNDDQGIYLEATSGNVNITNCTVFANYRQGIYVTSTDVNITDCTIQSNGINTAVEGIYLTSTSGNVNITGCTLTSNGNKNINIESSGNNVLRNNNINDTNLNLYVTGNYDNDIDTSNRINGGVVYYFYSDSSVSLTDVDDVGHITLYNCSNVLIKDNTLVTNGDGIRLIASTANVTIDNNALNSSNYYGIVLSSSRANITSNTITSTDSTAILLSSSDDCVITDNTVSANTANGYSGGIGLSNSNDNNISSNTVTATQTSGAGISLSTTSNSNTIFNNTIDCSGGNGISISGSSNNGILNNTVKNRDNSGLVLADSDYNTVQYNDLIDNGFAGVAITGGGSHNIITQNDILSNDCGGYQYGGVSTLDSSTNNSISDNTISSNAINGIYVASAGNFFSNNTIASNTDNGIAIVTDDNTYSNNTITIGGGYGFYITFGQYDNCIHQNNTVNGENIYYYCNTTTQTVAVEPLTATHVSNVGKISLIKCSNFEIKDNTLSNNTYIDGGIPSGIFLYNSSDITISNNTISDNYAGIYFYNSSYNTINFTNRINTSENSGIYFNISNYNNIINNNLALNTICGINFTHSDHNNITSSNITGSPEGILFETSLNNSLYANNITSYSSSAIRLIEYCRNNTMIGNLHTRNGAEFDIYINDSSNNTIAPNETAAANYTFYLTDDTRLCTLDTVFNKSLVGYEDTSSLTIMWRIDVFSWDNSHMEPIWGNLTVRYGDYSEVGGILIWDGEVSNANGRLSDNPRDYWGPPNSTDNWLPVIEYRENATAKTNYQSTPMNCTVINRWDVLQGVDSSYRNIITQITGPGVTVIVNAGYTPNGKCYYCHEDKLTFIDMIHWTRYSENLIVMSDPYTPGRCIDCHDENDSVSLPHGTESGRDLLVQQSPGLCYTGNGSQTCHNTNEVRATLNQEEEFNKTRHHQMGDGKLSCFACHDNHGSGYRYDLHKCYTDTLRPGSYNSYNFDLCFVCHLEEKITARPNGVSGRAAWEVEYGDQTNMVDLYYGSGFNNGNLNEVNHHKLHAQQWRYACIGCHNAHGSDNPAMTRYKDKFTGTKFNYQYITNISPPDEYANYIVLTNPDDWSNSTLNQAGGLYGGGCGCHGGKIPTYFAYRTFVDYESAGGPGCVECHDSGDPDAIRPIVNLTAMKIAMHTNLSAPLRNGEEDWTGRNWTEWGDELGYNASNYSTDNAICWACHCTNGTPPYPGFHPDRSLTPYKCPKCHGPVAGQPPHTQGLVKAIDNHGPTTKGADSISVQTDVGNNGSCEDCHAPSLLPDEAIGSLSVWKYSAGGTTAYIGRTVRGDVSHYGLSKSQGFAYGIENPLFNTSDCLYCHCNSTQGAIWGNAMNVSGNMYGADTTNVSECYTYCHVRTDYLLTINETTIPHFHNISLYAGGGPDCVVCHDVNSAFGLQSLVNATSISEGLHGNVTNNTIEIVPGIDPKSKPCWGCHQSDGNQPEGMGDRNGVVDPTKRPWTCEDCHARSSDWVAATSDGATWLASSYPPNTLPPMIYAHYPNSPMLKTNVHAAGRCVDCHDNSMDLAHGDTYAATLGNTIGARVSHYGTNAELIAPTADCAICHNSTNATEWGSPPQNRHGNFSDYFDADEGCYICHTDNDSTPVDFHAQNLWAGRGGFDCLRCHDTEGYAVRKRINTSIFGQAIHRNLNNASEVGYDYGLNRSCWVCHFENGLNADNHSMRKDPPYLCYDCHNKDAAPFENVSDAPLVYNHFRDGTNITAYQTQNTTSESCMGCHNQSEMFYFYLPDENEATPYYTNFSITSHYGSNRTDLVAIFDGSPNSNQYCWYCHLNASTPFMEYVLSKSIVHIGKFDCSDCHGTGRLHSDTLTRPLTGMNCTDCHLEGGGNASTGFSIINKTGFFGSVHYNITGDFSATNYTQLSYVCWGCHVNYSQELTDLEHVIIEPDCSDCHCNATPLNVNHLRRIPPQVIQHQPDSNDIITAANCTLCHNMSLVAGMPPVTNVTKPTQRNFVSHYARQRTDIIIDGGNASNCTYCHFDGGNEFGAVFANPGSSDIRHGVNCTPCHGYGRIHDAAVYGVGDDATLTETYQTSNISTGDIIGEISYTQPYVTLESFNLTWDNGTLELVVVPPAALDAGGMNISEYATTYYNNSTVWNVSGSGTSDRFNANLALNDTTNSTYKFVKVDNPAEGNWRFYIVALDANNTSASVTISQNYKVFARCTKCHMETGANATATNLMINETGFTTGIHQNVTGEFSSTDYFQLSRVCWGCHVNYTGQNASPSHTKPAIELPVCEACHYNSTPLNINYLNITPLQVREHQPLGDEIKTNSSIANCTICHNKSLTITPPDTNIKYPRAKNYISHYGRQRTDMWVTDANNNTITNCSYCHFDGGREFDDVFVLVNNTNITHGVDCVACHGSGRFHDAILKMPVMTEDNDACLYCHNNMSNKQILTAEFGTSAHLNVNCIDCHTPRQVFKGMVVNGESRTYNFSMPSSVTCLNATLEWGGGSILALTLNGPSSTYSGTSINISSPQSGNWNAVVQDVNGDAEFNLTINVTMSHSGSTAKTCDECHISGFDDTPLVYKHLTKQSNVPTNATCVLCHANSAYTATAMTTSHYAPTNLIDTKDCIRCHTGIVDGWGNAPDQRNHTDHYFVTGNLANGETWKLVDNYTLTLIETTLRSAMLVLEKDGVLLLRDVVTVGNEFEYEISGMEDDKTSIVNLTVDQVFTAPGHYVVDLSGYILGSHIHRETDNKECYACHDREHRTNIPDGIDYYVLKKVDDNVTLGQMPVNFKENDKKTLRTGEYWDLGENYSLYVEEVSLTKENARVLLYRNETLIEDIILSKGNSFTREEWVLDREIDVFGMTMDNVFISKTTPVIVLSNVWLIAGDQKTLDENTPVTQANTLVKYLPLDSSITVGEEPEDFHAGTIMPGVYSPDCISCHAGNGIAPIKIDIDAFKEGVHPGLNRNATYTSFITDETNKACWACHGNGSSDEPIRHPTPYFGNHTAITCIGCHGDSQFGAKKIYTHYPNAEISTDATCGDCHSNTFTNTTPKNIQAATSHYSTKEDLLNSSLCDTCHNNETNGLIWGKAPQVAKHIADNNCTLCHAGEGTITFHDSGITVTRNCEDCHVNKEQAEKFDLSAIRTHYPGAPEENVDTLKQNYTCRVCHNATDETLHINLEVREYSNESMGYCFACHSVEGKFPHKSEAQIDVLRHGSGIKVISGCEACHSPEGLSKYHTPTLVGKQYFRGTVRHDVNCTSCHEKHEERKYQPYEGIQCIDCHTEYGTAHYVGLPVEMVDITTTCPICHNEEADVFHNLTHVVANVTESAYDPCSDCHYDIESLIMEYDITTIAGTMSSITQPSDATIITCTSCHNATGESRFHYDPYPLGTVQYPDWPDWTDGNVTGCKDCHTYHGGELPFNATNMGILGRSAAGTAHGYSPSCTVCHGGADPISFHTLATSQFIPRLATTIDPAVLPRGGVSFLQVTVVLPQLTKVTRAEYFVDEIERTGYGEPLEYIFNESNDSSVSLGALIDTTDMSYGKHPIFIHVKDSSGKWSKMDVAVLIVEKVDLLAATEIILKDVVPATIFIGVLFFIWRRFK